MPASLTQKLLFWIVPGLLGTMLVTIGVYKIVMLNTTLLADMSHWIFFTADGGLILLATLQIIRLRITMNRSAHTDI